MSDRHHSTVKRFNVEHGYGLITANNDQRVQYDIADVERGMVAQKVISVR